MADMNKYSKSEYCKEYYENTDPIQLLNCLSIPIGILYSILTQNTCSCP